MFGSQPIGISRRALLKDAACGFGYLAFAGLASQAAAAERNPLAAKLPHFAARAKRVIFMFMHGGPSQVDTFDYKPTLAKYSGQPAPFVKASDRRRAAQEEDPAAAPDSLEIRPAWPERPLGLRAVSARRPARGRPVRDQQHAHRRPRPRRGHPAAAHGDRQFRPTVARVVGHVRTGDRKQQPARLHHDCPAACSRRRAELLQRVPAGHLSRDGDRHGRRPGEGRLDPLSLQRQAFPRDAAAAARPDPAVEPVAPPTVRGRCADRRDGAVVRARPSACSRRRRRCSNWPGSRKRR